MRVIRGFDRRGRDEFRSTAFGRLEAAPTGDAVAMDADVTKD